MGDTKTITFDLAEGLSWTTYGVGDSRGLLRQLTEEEARALLACQIVRAQHDETGRIWEGPRGQIPPRYSEILNSDEVGQ